MKSLKAGGTAVDAVEAAIKVLENNEITNAGYGSNLSIDGIVECDATIVDHFGRSGACGAVSSEIESYYSHTRPPSLLKFYADIKNPISLARKILDTSSQALTLRRVPPNFLVGEGAKQFAIEHDIPIVTNEELTSRNAQDRYNKWRADLQRVTKALNSPGPTPTRQTTPLEGTSPVELGKSQDQMTPRTKAQKGLLRDHSSAILTGMWNEGQPDSPSSDLNSSTSSRPDIVTPKPRRPGNPPMRDRNVSSSGSPVKRAKIGKDGRDRMAQGDSTWASDTESDSGDDQGNDEVFPDMIVGEDASIGLHTSTHQPVKSNTRTSQIATTELTAEPNDTDLDLITDTMGAIAIDMNGNIAAGSSSGGIGMKHMGRTGPAALVGVGTAVIPLDLEDPETKVVATVTSGTGEHMATTMAAQRCAERLYQGTKRGNCNRDTPEDDPSIIMQSFIEKDFMGHPGVRNQASASAIGVMAVEVNYQGIYMHWAHNTDSFALASFGSDDKVPATCMSRLPKGARVNIGARKVQKSPYPSW